MLSCRPFLFFLLSKRCDEDEEGEGSEADGGGRGAEDNSDKWAEGELFIGGGNQCQGEGRLLSSSPTPPLAPTIWGGNKQEQQKGGLSRALSRAGLDVLD